MNLREILSRIRNDKKKVLVVGLGISGIETARYLATCGIAPVCVEKASEASYQTSSKFGSELGKLRALGVDLHFGIDGEKVGAVVNDVAVCVVSPGVSLESSICGALKRKGLKLISELELGVELLGIPSVVVTGSNGKSTTATLIAHVLQHGGVPSFLCGNVGTPVISGATKDDLDKPAQRGIAMLVVEASSYQLESCQVLKPKVGVFLNLSDNHLERHGTLERYLAAKARLFACQDANDIAVLNVDDPFVSTLTGKVKSQVRGITKDPLSRFRSKSALIVYDKGRGLDQIVYRLDGNEEIYDVSSTKLIGLHNRYDIAASIVAARALGVAPDSILASLKTFVPLEHRLEAVPHPSGKTFVNDSKSTTVAATSAALESLTESFPNRRITLLIGGLSKAGAWTPVMNSLRNQAKRMNTTICFGKDGSLLANHCQASGVPCKVARNLEEAVQMSYKQSKSDDLILLSPGCASFDEFTDFEHRGNVFKSLVSQL